MLTDDLVPWFLMYCLYIKSVASFLIRVFLIEVKERGFSLFYLFIIVVFQVFIVLSQNLLYVLQLPGNEVIVDLNHFVAGSGPIGRVSSHRAQPLILQVYHVFSRSFDVMSLFSGD